MCKYTTCSLFILHRIGVHILLLTEESKNFSIICGRRLMKQQINDYFDLGRNTKPHITHTRLMYVNILYKHDVMYALASSRIEVDYFERNMFAHTRF